MSFIYLILNVSFIYLILNTDGHNLLTVAVYQYDENSCLENCQLMIFVIKLYKAIPIHYMEFSIKTRGNQFYVSDLGTEC